MEEKANKIGRDESKAGKSGLLNLVLDVNACIFLTSFLVYLVLLVMEKVREGSVSSFTDVDIVLYICLAAGFLHILAGMYGPEAVRTAASGRSRARSLPLPAAAASLAALLTYHLMSSYGIYGVLIAVAAGILTVTAVYAGFYARDGDEE